MKIKALLAALLLTLALSAPVYAGDMEMPLCQGPNCPTTQRMEDVDPLALLIIFVTSLPQP